MEADSRIAPLECSMHRPAMSLLPRFAFLLLSLAAAGARAEATEANVVYGYAQVLRVSAVYVNQRVSAPDPRCERRAGAGGAGGAGGAVAGALVGGAVGTQVGKGNGRTAATVAGALLGGALGHKLAAGSLPEGCRNGELERIERRIAGYDVEYQFQGQTYMSRLPVDPGNRLRVRVSVTPDDPALGIR
jgi:uncharacterized protein YcfJ